MFLLLFVCVQFLHPATSAPVPTPQQHTFVSWNSEPQTRGTFSLLSGCLITLSLSVWTAVHLNIIVEQLPNENWSFFRRLYNRPAIRRLKWVTIALLAPELVVYTAWQQWSSARKMTRTMRKLLKQAEEDGKARAEYEWTMVHSFYAGMGGFVIDISGSPFSRISSKPELKPYIPGDCCQLTLTAQGALFLAASGYLPSLSKKAILDRSKADGIAKTLVCLQAGYMIVQCATRVASKLPVSLLEVNTLGHVFCALVVYSFWLNKPQDIHTPTHMSDEAIRPICAFMYQGSTLSKSFLGGPRESRGLTRRTIPYSKETLREWDRSDLPPHRLILLPPWEPSADTVITVRENETLKGTELGPELSSKHRITRKEQKEVGYKNHSAVEELPFAYRPAAVHLNECGVTRWELASSFRCSDLEYIRQSLVDTGYLSYSQFLVREVPNWPEDAGHLSGSIYTTWVAIALAVGLYGGLHVSARNSHFPTFIEKMMWCASSILIAGSGAVALIYIFLYRIPIRGKGSFSNHSYWKLYNISRKRFFWHQIFIILDRIHDDVVWPFGFIVFGLAYVFARIFIVVEAFISLRDLPVEVYQTPNWTQLIPHL